MCDKWYGIQSSIFGIRLPNDLRQTERISINQETHQWNNRGICTLCRGIRKLNFHNLSYFGDVKAWKVLPAIKHKVVRPPAAALILSLLFLAWLLFALCHLFPVSSFVRPPPSPFYPPPTLLIRLGWMPLKNASRGTNMHKQTPICQIVKIYRCLSHFCFLGESDAFQVKIHLTSLEEQTRARSLQMRA